MKPPCEIQKKGLITEAFPGSTSWKWLDLLRIRTDHSELIEAWSRLEGGSTDPVVDHVQRAVACDLLNGFNEVVMLVVDHVGRSGFARQSSFVSRRDGGEHLGADAACKLD